MSGDQSRPQPSGEAQDSVAEQRRAAQAARDHKALDEAEERRQEALRVSRNRPSRRNKQQ